MSKLKWNIILTVFFCGVMILCIYVQMQYSESLELPDMVTFSISCDTATDEIETVKCWRQSQDKCFVFLPSYAKIEDIVIHLNSLNEVYIGDLRVTEGARGDGLELNKDYSLKHEDYVPTTIRFVQSSDVSSMFISTAHDNLSNINENKTAKESINICLHKADGKVDYSTHSFNDKIRGHGNTTWDYDKKSYNLYLKNAVSLLSMNNSTDWVLLANALDETNLRSKIVYDFINEISGETQIAPRCEYVELFIDGEYLGLYLLTEKLSNIVDRDVAETGYTLISQNNQRSKMDYPESAIKLHDKYFEIADSEEFSAETNRSLEKFLNSVDQKLYTREWADYIDIHSFAVKYLIEEIFSNKDGADASQYYYWDKENEQLYSGPCWDYDLTMGDTTWVQWVSPNNLYIQNNLWYKQIFGKQEFVDYYKNLYRDEFLPVINNYLEDRIHNTYSFIESASADNYIRWSGLYKTDGYAPDEMIAFLSKHIEFLNSIWIDEERYYKVSFQTNGKLPIVDYYVPENSTVKIIPTPSEMGIDGEYDWISEKTGKLLDYSSYVNEDMQLYIDDPAINNVLKKSKLKIALVILSITVLFVFFIIILKLDYRNSFGKGITRHE